MGNLVKMYVSKYHKSSLSDAGIELQRSGWNRLIPVSRSWRAAGQLILRERPWGIRDDADSSFMTGLQGIFYFASNSFLSRRFESWFKDWKTVSLLFSHLWSTARLLFFYEVIFYSLWCEWAWAFITFRNFMFYHFTQITENSLDFFLWSPCFRVCKIALWAAQYSQNTVVKR